MHGLQLVKVLPSHPVPLGRQGNKAVTSEHGKRTVGIIPQVKPLVLPPLH
jgi:hypothetical protein